MSIFRIKEKKKPSLIGKILKNTPKENALIEINNLLVKHENDLTKVTLEQIQEISDKYKSKLNNKFKTLRLDLFKQYATHCLKDHIIDDDEIKIFLHLKKLLHLNDIDIEQILDNEKMKVYDEEVKKSVADGELSQ
ncbi:MAG TPA: hypothetical protein ENH91_10790, partial [Leeuwenhoekiella sp.]|nr:hypothetical protein [Leeuwenhoekiella sp.]